MKAGLIGLFLTGSILSASGQNWDIKVRQSFQSLDAKKEPAAFLVTLPYNKPSSVVVDGGIALRRDIVLNRLYFRFDAEYHQNTLIEKIQKNGLAGAGLEWYVRPTAGGFNLNYVVNTDLNYVRNVVDSTGSFVWTSEVALFSNSPGHKIMFNKPFFLDTPQKYVQAVLSPSLGHEYQDTFDTPLADRDSLRGKILRGILKLNASLNLCRFDATQGVSIPVVTLYANTTFRYDLVNKTKTPAGWHPLLETGVRYVLTNDESLSLALSYTTGENPFKGLVNQQFWLVAIRFQR